MASISDPQKPCLIEEEVESIIAFSESPFEEGNVSSVPVNRLMWEAVIFGCL